MCLFALLLKVHIYSQVLVWFNSNGVSYVSQVTVHQAHLVLRLVYCVGVWPATQANSASYPQRDRKWVQAKRQRSEAGNVTVGLSLQQPCVTDSLVYQPMGLPTYVLSGLRNGDECPTYIRVWVCHSLPFKSGIISLFCLPWHCWLAISKCIHAVKIEYWGAGVVICLEWGASELHMVQLMPLPPHHLLLH